MSDMNFAGRALHAGASAALYIASLALLALPVAAEAQVSAGRIISEQGEFDGDSKQSQTRVERYAQQTSELLGEYRITIQQLDRIRIYNENLERLVADQEAAKQEINQQLEDFGETEQGIVPLMLEMIEDLRQFIRLDMPFQLRERQDRVEKLAENMDRSELTVSERYRQIIEAYKIEAEFGRNIEAYEGSLMLEGIDTQVNFLRVGRIVLAYQTKDKQQTGFFNKLTEQWEPLPSSYRRAVTDGIALAKKQTAPQILSLPVPSAEAAE